MDKTQHALIDKMITDSFRLLVKHSTQSHAQGGGTDTLIVCNEGQQKANSANKESENARHKGQKKKEREQPE